LSCDERGRNVDIAPREAGDGSSAFDLNKPGRQRRFLLSHEGLRITAKADAATPGSYDFIENALRHRGAIRIVRKFRLLRTDKLERFIWGVSPPSVRVA